VARPTYVNGALYGTTYGGGANGNGIVFKIATSGKETVLHRFEGGSDGSHAIGGVAYAGGTLYGTTTSGGTSEHGTVFSITLSGKETVLYSFAGGSDGDYPQAGLLDVGGTLYGTSLYGGVTGCAAGCGTVFSITTSGAENVVYRFQGGSDGEYPLAGLINVGGTLYGTTDAGGLAGCGNNGCGTVYKVTTSGTHGVLHEFTGGSDGALPTSRLSNVNGMLYGTATGGGAYRDGAIFSMTTSGTENVVYSFTGGTDGGLPEDLTNDANGILYGATSDFSNCITCGTVFSLKL
jgi:uncharacterized repeat protein (TIGR03803 family)